MIFINSFSQKTSENVDFLAKFPGKGHRIFLKFRTFCKTYFVAIQTGPVFLQGTYGNICAYYCSGQWRFRQKSTLTGKRVKTSPRFRNTMLFAGLMARSSKIAAVIYKALPPHWKQSWMYRAFVGEAMNLLKEGKTNEETPQVLWQRYAAEFTPGYKEEQEFTQVIINHQPIRPAYKSAARKTNNRRSFSPAVKIHCVHTEPAYYEELLL